MNREQCHTCEMLKQYYSLKFNQFVLAGRSGSTLPGNGQGDPEEQLAQLKDEALDALTVLMRHAKVCYGLVSETQNEAA